MGCQTSKAFHADNVDDSIHAMLQREKRQALEKGQHIGGYRPRAPHPLLSPKTTIVCEEEEDEMKTMELESTSSGWRDDVVWSAALKTSSGSVSSQPLNELQGPDKLPQQSC